MTNILDIEKARKIREEAKRDSQILVSLMQKCIDKDSFQRDIDWQKYEEELFKKSYEVKLSIFQKLEKFKNEEKN